MAVTLWLAGLGSHPAYAQTPEPEVRRLPLLPAEQAWLVTLPAAPAAGGAMDAESVYIPLGPRPVEAMPQAGTEQVVALDRETGERRWARDLASAWPPVVAEGRVLIAAADGIHALDVTTGERQWSTPLGGAIVAAPASAPGLLIVLTSGDLIALRLQDGTPAWRHEIGSVGPPAAVSVADGALYLSLKDSRVVRASLDDGRPVWERTLSGTLGPPALARDRLLVGSSDNYLYALHAADGRFAWRYQAGGDVVGAAVHGEQIFFVALDNVLRALDRGSGNQRWKALLETRASAPPRVFEGIVLVAGLSPALAAFATDTGAALGMYAAPSDLVAPALVDPDLRPFGVAIVAITGDGRVTGLRPGQMMFREPPPVPLTVLPGRALDPDGEPPTAPSRQP